MGLDAIPGICRAEAYDFCSGAWRNLAVNISGEVKVARGETLQTAAPVMAPVQSGGIVLGSGVVDRVIIKVPKITCSGILTTCSCANLLGIWVGGASGTGNEPYPGSGCIGSGYGLFVEPGEQKELYVKKLEEIHVASEGFNAGTSGYWPVTYLAEITAC